MLHALSGQFCNQQNVRQMVVMLCLIDDEWEDKKRCVSRFRKLSCSPFSHICFSRCTSDYEQLIK